METLPAEAPSTSPEFDPSEEVRHVPLWVKGLVAVGLALFLIQLPGFASSLSDAIEKKKASSDYDKGRFVEAAGEYQALHARYPTDTALTGRLGLAQYRAGQYVDALGTFDQLAGVRMSKSEVKEIDAAITDIAEKLNLKTN